jgi:hypothetical protein
MIPADSLDFVFSFDSLVHVEAPQIAGYVHDLARALKPGGAGFIHHSNLEAYAQDGVVPDYVTERHWRAPTMSARLFREACRDAGLHCGAQELINWIGRGAAADHYRLPGERVPLTDCFSAFVRPAGDHPTRPTRVYLNRRFVDEWRQLIVLAELYSRQSHLHPTRPAALAAEIPQAVPDRGPVATLRARLAHALRETRSRRARLATARAFAHRERFARDILRGRCPGCGARLNANACAACDVLFVTEARPA